ATKYGGNVFDRFDDLLCVLSGEADWKRIDFAELFEKHRFAFHNRKSSFRTDVAQTEDGGSICYHRNGIPFYSEFIDVFRVIMDRHADARHTRGVSHREIIACSQGNFVGYPNLATKVHEERSVRDVHHLVAVQFFQFADEKLAVLRIAHFDADVANDKAC